MTRMISLLLGATLAGLSLPAVAQQATATVELMDTSGNSLGTLTLTEGTAGVHITGTLTGVPNGEHGLHIHETGTCDAAGEFESAGGHFEPGSQQHGMENPEGPHAGDLPNVNANDDGAAIIGLTNVWVTLGEGESSLFDADGSALVLHADSDDYVTDPSGNSGDRIGCGVIEAN